MWKMVAGFIVFAGIVMFVLFKSGGDLDLGGEKHGVDAVKPAEGEKKP